MRRVAPAAAIFIAALSLPCSGAAQLPLTLVADVPLPGDSTRLDYQTLDESRHLLFVAHLGDGAVIVVDARTSHVVKVVGDVSAVHGVLAIPELDMTYASATGTNEVVAIDESTLKIRARMAGGVYPDGMAFDPVTRRLFVSDEHGATETVIDAKTNRRISTIALGGEAGNTQYDPISRRIFVNVQTLGQLVEIDPARNRIVRRIAVSGQQSGCISNHGLLIDASMRRAFIACEESGTLLQVDMRNMRIVATWNIGEDPDVIALDPQTHFLFVAAESGNVSVFSNGRTVTRIGQAFLAPYAHTVAVDPRTQLVYFPLQNIGGKPVLRVMKERHSCRRSSSKRTSC